MAISWAEKKAAMQELIEAYYAPPLREEGFISYKDEGFHWYRVKGELLQTVHMPIFSPSQPIMLDLTFGAVPLFTWEEIAPAGAARDFSWDFHHGSDHVASVAANATVPLAEELIGKLPRKSYMAPGLAHHLDNGLLIMHLYSERCGGEAVDELILPLLDTMESVEDIYRWNKSLKAEGLHCLSEEAMLELFEKEYLGTDKYIYFMSLAFADECLYCEDERFYPFLLHALRQKQKNRVTSPGRPKTKTQAAEWAADGEHEAVLIQVLETGDRALFEEELAKQKARMLAQIRKKLPGLKLDGV